MTASDQPPLTCRLGAGDYRRRIAWIAELTRRALRKYSRDELVLRLVYAPGAAEEVRQMVEQERECCAFLAFDLSEGTDAARVTITAPEAARGSADLLFGHFLPGGDASR
jgi:hypothetical protein